MHWPLPRHQYPAVATVCCPTGPAPLFESTTCNTCHVPAAAPAGARCRRSSRPLHSSKPLAPFSPSNRPSPSAGPALPWQLSRARGTAQLLPRTPPVKPAESQPDRAVYPHPPQNPLPCSDTAAPYTTAQHSMHSTAARLPVRACEQKGRQGRLVHQCGHPHTSYISIYSQAGANQQQGNIVAYDKP